MGSYYQCSDPDSNEKSWTGRIRPLNINRNEFEGIGTEISSLSDCFWNRERLEQDYPELSKVDIISIVKTLEAHSAHM